MADYKGDQLTKLSGNERLGMHRDSEYLGAEDIDPGSEPILTIEGLYYGKVTLQRGKEFKDVIQFVERAVPGLRNVRPLIINATNRKALKKIYKSVDADTLTGKKVQLYVDSNVKDPQTGGVTDGIRIRPFIPKEKEYFCEDCKRKIVDSAGMTVQQIVKRSSKRYGKQLCAECAIKAKEADEVANQEGDVLNNENNENQN